ncbi:hypothetical protein [Moorena producens]|uniref:hypothetical protein n=1 Tax=Moorena producens TaxID=1155739 RepID=UPI003C76CD52
MAKRPRVRVQPSTLQPWPKGHGCAFNLQLFNLGQKATGARSTFNLQPSTFNPSTLQPF